MKIRIAGLLLALGLVCLAGCAPSLTSQSLDDLARTPSLRSAHIGFSARSLTEDKNDKDNEKLPAINEGKFFVPASVTKLFTSAVSLVLLGPDFRFETGLYTDSFPKDGLIRGNLFIRGSGDPTLSARFHNGGGSAVFSQWADRLVASGVRRIEGDIVGDGGLYEGGPLGRGWSWDDELYCFSAQISALSFNDNCVSILVAPGSQPGDKAHVTVEDRSDYVIVLNETVTGQPNEGPAVTIARRTGNNLIAVAGRVPFNARAQEYRVAIQNPTLFAAMHLKRVLEAKGITVTGSATDQKTLQTLPAYESLHVLAQYTSPPLSEIIKHINKPSQNLYAELLFLSLGNRFGGQASAERASQVVGETLSRMGIDPQSFLAYDGSGLSRLNLVKPQAVVELLSYMYRHAHFRYFLESLPVAGVDGTLRSRMRNTGAQGIVRAKTGTLAHVRNLAGYVEGRAGKMIAFAIMINNYAGPVQELKAFQDAICIMLSPPLD
jgi:serine-type D-Ala-D-Ala carboxypeptidase/endopeptidase (penicillin-binding protein 4)